MIHLSTPPELRAKNGGLIIATLTDPAVPTNRFLFGNQAAGVNAATGVIIALSLVVTRPHRLFFFSYQQSIAQAGSETCDLLLSHDTLTDAAAGRRDRALSGSTAGTGSFRPSNVPTVLTMSLHIRSWFTQYKALFRNAAAATVLQAINFGIELE